MTGSAPDRGENLEALQQHLGYHFSNLEILCQALTHRSYLQNGSGVAEEGQTDPPPCEHSGHNERLEFLGDAVLGLAISDLLFRQYPDHMEGPLSHWRSSLVNIHALARIAHAHQLGRFLHMGRGELLSGGRGKSSLLGNAVEALLGAVYLDGGYAAAHAVVQRLFADILNDPRPGQWEKDYKSLLQERLQGAGLELPRYPVVTVDGAPHERVFQIACVVRDDRMGDAPFSRIGFGRSKRSAEQSAAKAVFMALYTQETDGPESSWHGPETEKEPDDA